MPKNQPVRIIDSRRSPATGGGGGVVLPGHTHDDRYYTDAEIAALLAGYLPVTGVTTGATTQAQTFTSGVIDSSLTASRLLASNGSKQLASVANLADWIAGTANQVTVTNDGDGSVTLALPQNIHTAATPTFSGVIAGYIRPVADSTTALQLQNAAGTTALLTVDSTNNRITMEEATRPETINAIGDRLIIGTRTVSPGVSQFIRAGLAYSDWTGSGVFTSVAGFNAFAYKTGTGASTGAPKYGNMTGSRVASRILNATGTVATAVGLSAYVENGGIDGEIAGTVTHAIAVLAEGNEAGTGTLTNSYGVYIKDALVQSGTIGTNYGIYVEDINDGTTDYAIYTNAGAVRLGDTVTANVGLIVNESGNATGDFRAESDTEADMVFLDASADLLYLGGTTNGVRIAKGGDTAFLGDGSGLPYGSCYGNEIGWTQASAAQDTWYEVSDADMADGELNGVTHDGSGKLTVAVAGRYLINYTCSAEVSLPGKHVQSGISISGTEVAAGISHYNAASANEQFNTAGTAILDLAANATIEVSLRTTDTGTPDLSVDHLNITVVMVGGS